LIGKEFQSRKDFDFEAMTKLPENLRWFRVSQKIAKKTKRGRTEGRRFNRREQSEYAERGRGNFRVWIGGGAAGRCCKELQKGKKRKRGQP